MAPIQHHMPCSQPCPSTCRSLVLIPPVYTYHLTSSPAVQGPADACAHLVCSGGLDKPILAQALHLPVSFQTQQMPCS